jgi:hypothetical protein
MQGLGFKPRPTKKKKKETTHFINREMLTYALGALVKILKKDIIALGALVVKILKKDIIALGALVKILKKDII